MIQANFQSTYTLKVLQMTFDHGKLLGSLTSDFGAAAAVSSGLNNGAGNANLSSPLPESLSSRDPDLQTVTQCYGDYNRIPYGWRQSPFMGQCGYKIQLNDFYSASSPCYPVQDISCLGANEKKAWAHICSAEFPCKHIGSHPSPGTYRVPPDSHIVSLNDIFYEGLPVILGSVLGACLLVPCLGSRVKDDVEDSADVTPQPERTLN